MKLAGWLNLVDPQNFTATPEFTQIKKQVTQGVAAVKWPPGKPTFAINPVRKGNGVKPIKTEFITSLIKHGWVPEYSTFDAHYTFPAGGPKPFVVEWETGNISSSHRAINRIGLGILQQRICGGVLVVPTKALYLYLTDRVGNFAELEPYVALWEEWEHVPNFGYFGIVTVEHDKLDPSAPLIRKGTDGRALV